MESSSQSSTQHDSESDAIHSSSTSSKAESSEEQEKLDEELARKLSMPRMTRAQLAAEAKKLEKKQLAEIKKRQKEKKELEKKGQRQEREKARAEKKKWYAQEMKERKEGKAKKVVREVLGHPCCTNGLVKPQDWIGAYSPESRKVRLERFRQKRNHRVWTKKVKYGVRKNFADSRMRVKGRFVKKQDELLMRELISLT
jgi:hypothetical protein